MDDDFFGDDCGDTRDYDRQISNRDFNLARERSSKAAFRQGVADGTQSEEHSQLGFDNGYRLSAEINSSISSLKGSLVCSALFSKLPGSTMSAQDTNDSMKSALLLHNGGTAILRLLQQMYIRGVLSEEIESPSQPLVVESKSDSLVHNSVSSSLEFTGDLSAIPDPGSMLQMRNFEVPSHSEKYWLSILPSPRDEAERRIQSELKEAVVNLLEYIEQAQVVLQRTQPEIALLPSYDVAKARLNLLLSNL